MERDLEEENSRSCDGSSIGFEIGSDDLAENIKLLEEFVAGADGSSHEAGAHLAENSELPDNVAGADEKSLKATGDVAKDEKLFNDLVDGADENQNDAPGQREQREDTMSKEILANIDRKQNGDDKNIVSGVLENAVDGSAGGDHIVEAVGVQDSFEEGQLDEDARSQGDAEEEADINCNKSKQFMKSGVDSDGSRRRPRSRSVSKGQDPIGRRNRSRSRRGGSYSRNRERNRSRGANSRMERRRDKGKPKVSRVLGAFGLNYSTTEKDLWRIFGEYGHVKQVALPLKRGAFYGENKGFGFVTFSSESEATRAKDALHDTGEIEIPTFKLTQ